MSSHDDETGAPCTRHVPLASDVILTYAAIGARVSSFHHDVASKLQSLMMAIDEISELASDDVRPVAATAMTALQELNQLLVVNRALAKAPQRKPTKLRDLVARAAERHGVRIRGDVLDINVVVALPSIAHALDMLFDMLAGPLKGPRSVALEVTQTGDRVTLALTAMTKFEAHPELIELAAFLLGREEGALSCTPNGFVVVLPT